MPIVMTILSYILALGIGYLCGRFSKYKYANRYADFFYNQCQKQSKAIREFDDRLMYFTVGDIGELYTVLSDIEDLDDDQPLLGIMYPFDEPGLRNEDVRSMK